MTVWIPKPVKGYSVGDVQAALAAGGATPNISRYELDTPALCVDLDIFERNLTTMAAALEAAGVASRPHAKTHKSVDVARRQMATGSIGICAAKVSEAEALLAGGIEHMLMTTSNVTPYKIRRAMRLRAQHPHFIQAVDNTQTAHDLSAAAAERGIDADVVIDVAVGTRTGVPAGEPALALAQLVDSLPNLTLRGIISYDGTVQHIKGFAARSAQTLERFAPSVATYEAMVRAGLNTEIFSGGGTGTYNILSRVPGLTDVQVGSYVFMDAQYLEIGGASDDTRFTDFTPSLTVLTTVLNAHFPSRLTTDAGAKALTINQPPPIVLGEPVFLYDASSDEFGSIRYTHANRSYAVGDTLDLIVSHCDPVVNQYDVMFATRNDRVEAVWPVTARGCSQ